MTPEQKKRMEENRVSNAKLAERLAAKKAGEAPDQEPLSRIQQGYREDADRQNPNPAITTFDGHGRPKEKSNNHKWAGQP